MGELTRDLPVMGQQGSLVRRWARGEEMTGPRSGGKQVARGSPWDASEPNSLSAAKAGNRGSVGAVRAWKEDLQLNSHVPGIPKTYWETRDVQKDLRSLPVILL